MPYNFREDGVTHLNIYSKGKTELGRFLSNFCLSPVDTPDGEFASIEGYWYWLGTEHPDREELRRLHGWEAKKIGRQLKAVSSVELPDFRDRIRSALRNKLFSRPDMLLKLLNNDLPLAHYYVQYGRVTEPPGNEWLVEFFENFDVFS